MSREGYDSMIRKSAERRAAIAAHHAKHGTRKTLARYKITRQRLHQVLVQQGVRVAPKVVA